MGNIPLWIAGGMFVVTTIAAELAVAMYGLWWCIHHSGIRCKLRGHHAYCSIAYLDRRESRRGCFDCSKQWSEQEWQSGLLHGQQVKKNV